MAYETLFEQAGRKYNVDPALLQAQMRVESNGNPNAVSEVGAQGLMQLMPATQRSLGVTNPNDPAQAIDASARLLAENLDRYGNVQDAIRAYHGGTNPANWGPKTQAYVNNVMKGYAGSAQQASPSAPDELDAYLSGKPAQATAAATGSVPTAQPDELDAYLSGTPTKTAAPVAQIAAPVAAGVSGQPPQSALGTAVDYVKSAVNPEIIGAGAIEGVNRATDFLSEKLAQGMDASGLTDYLKSKGIDPGTYAEQVAANKARRAAYDATNPSAAQNIAELGAEVGAVGGPLKAAGTALSAGGNALVRGLQGSEALGGLAAPAQALGNFVAGNGGMLSRMANAGVQGAAGGALLSGGGNENSLATQMALGGLLGAGSVPVISGAAKAGNALINSPLLAPLQKAATSEASVAPKAQAIVDDFAAKATAENGGATPTPGILDEIKKQVTAALRVGQEVDPAAIARKLEFESIGVQPTLGQITRNPAQFTAERNMRGVQGAGEGLANRFSEQNAQLNTQLNALGANKAVEPDVAGNALMSSLRAIDQPRAKAVSEAYQLARDTEGRYAGLDVPTFSTTANNALDEQMLGRFLPGNVRGMLNDISNGTIPLNVNTAVQADSVMSAAQRAAAATGDNAGAKAIGVVRDSLNNAPIDSAAGEAAKAQFDAARKLAAQRFAQIENAPGLKAALDDASPDSFVRKFLIQGDTPSVNALAKYMEADPQARNTARQQIAGYLQNKGFGTNETGDNTFAQGAYNKALNALGTNKLNAFFSPDEVARLRTIGKVGAYINSQPAGSAVNNSNSGAAVLNFLGSTAEKFGKLPGVNILRNSLREYQAETAAANALNAKVPMTTAPAATPNALYNLIAPVEGSSGAQPKSRNQ